MKTLKTLALCAVLFPASSSADEQIFCERFVCLLYPGETDCRFRPQVSECERIEAFEFYKSRQMYGTPIASMATHTLSFVRRNNGKLCGKRIGQVLRWKRSIVAIWTLWRKRYST